MKIFYRMNTHQQVFHADVTTKFLHMSAGYGAGKSFGLVMKGLHLSRLNQHKPGGFLCPSYKEYKRDILPIFEDVLNRNRIRYFYHRSDFYFQFPWTRGKLYIFSGKESIRGPNLAYGLINELTLIDLYRYREFIGRIRLKAAPNPQIASVGTPEGLSSPYHEMFIAKPIPNSRVIYGRTRDNLVNVGDDYIAQLEASYDKTMLSAYLEGEWVNMNGKAFYYAYDPKVNDVRGYKIPSHVFGFHIGIDFNVDPMCASVWVKDGEKIICIDQIKLEGGKGFDTHQLAAALIARGYTPDNSILYPDPAGNARSTKGRPDIEILRAHGFRDIRVKTVAPRLRERQLNSNNLLSKGLILIDPEKAPDMKTDLLAVEQDSVTLEKVKDNPKLTHFSDGMDYLVDILFPFSGRKPTVRQEKLR